jgi:hypothetical protein
MMHVLPCNDVREQLEAFHDGELPVDRQIAIQSHLHDCVACAIAADELDELSDSLRVMSTSLPDRYSDEVTRVRGRVLARIGAEEQFSARARLHALFQDMHLVWAALGATTAMFVCIFGSMSVLQAASQERPDSLAGLITYLANPGSNANPVPLDEGMLLPRARSDVDAFLPMSSQDGAFTMAAVVTREGRVQNLSMLAEDRARLAKVRPDVLLAMIDAVSRAQFEPAQAGGSPVAVNMVWLLTSMTVKGEPGDFLMLRRPIAPRLPLMGPAEKAPSPAAKPSTDSASASQTTSAVVVG